MCITCCVTTSTDTHTHTHTHSEYVIIVAFPLQQWFRERACVILSYGLSGCTIFFYILTQTTRLKKTGYKMFSYSLQLSSETFLILKIIQRDIIIHVHRYSSKLLVILVRFSWILNFLSRFSKNTQITNFMKIRPVGAELYADGRTDTKTRWT